MLAKPPLIRVIALAALAGCSAAGTSAPLLTYAQNDAPLSFAKRQALLYVTADSKVLIYSYPQLQLVGSLGGIPKPEGLCVNRRTGGTWVVSGPFSNRLTEFPHGVSAPVRILRLGSDVFIQACTVDPASGNVAVPVSLGDSGGDLAIFPPAAKKPATYRGSKIYNDEYAAYDSRGDVFVDGYGTNVGFRLAKFDSASKRFIDISLQGIKLHSPGELQFDGADITITGQFSRAIYRITERGVLVATVRLDGVCSIGQFFIDDGNVIVPSGCRSGGSLFIYRYPAGGKPIARITGLNGPIAAAISR